MCELCFTCQECAAYTQGMLSGFHYIVGIYNVWWDLAPEFCAQINFKGKPTYIAAAPHFKESKVLFFLRSKLRQYFIDVDVSTGALIADNDIDKKPVRSDRPGR